MSSDGTSSRARPCRLSHFDAGIALADSKSFPEGATDVKDTGLKISLAILVAMIVAAATSAIGEAQSRKLRQGGRTSVRTDQVSSTMKAR